MELEQVIGVLYTRFDCPGCSSVEEVEGDAALEDHQCSQCGAQVTIVEVR